MWPDHEDRAQRGGQDGYPVRREARGVGQRRQRRERECRNDGQDDQRRDLHSLKSHDANDPGGGMRAASAPGPEKI